MSWLELVNILVTRALIVKCLADLVPHHDSDRPIFGPREELTSPARQNFTTNRPRLRCLSDEHGLVALGLAARANVGAEAYSTIYAPAARMRKAPPVGMPRGMISL